MVVSTRQATGTLAEAVIVGVHICVGIRLKDGVKRLGETRSRQRDVSVDLSPAKKYAARTEHADAVDGNGLRICVRQQIGRSKSTEEIHGQYGCHAGHARERNTKWARVVGSQLIITAGCDARNSFTSERQHVNVVQCAPPYSTVHHNNASA